MLRQPWFGAAVGHASLSSVAFPETVLAWLILGAEGAFREARSVVNPLRSSPSCVVGVVASLVGCRVASAVAHHTRRIGAPTAGCRDVGPRTDLCCPSTRHQASAATRREDCVGVELCRGRTGGGLTRLVQVRHPVDWALGMPSVGPATARQSSPSDRRGHDRRPQAPPATPRTFRKSEPSAGPADEARRVSIGLANLFQALHTGRRLVRINSEERGNNGSHQTSEGSS